MEMQQPHYLDNDENFICPNCDTPMHYKYAGIYICETCGAEELNDFGKIKRYLDEHGPTNAIELSAQTGVKRSKIGEFLRLGRVEIPENSPVYIHCKGCGVAIRYGNYCLECVHSKNIKGAYAGEVAKGTRSKMRFIDPD